MCACVRVCLCVSACRHASVRVCVCVNVRVCVTADMIFNLLLGLCKYPSHIEVSQPQGEVSHVARHQYRGSTSLLPEHYQHGEY